MREMVADWLGAGRAITGKWEAAEWYLENAERMHLSYRAQMLVEMLLGVKARCSCGARGSTAARCRVEGYCQAHLIEIPQASQYLDSAVSRLQDKTLLDLGRNQSSAPLCDPSLSLLCCRSPPLRRREASYSDIRGVISAALSKSCTPIGYRGRGA